MCAAFVVDVSEVPLPSNAKNEPSLHVKSENYSTLCASFAFFANLRVAKIVPSWDFEPSDMERPGSNAELAKNAEERESRKSSGVFSRTLLLGDGSF